MKNNKKIALISVLMVAVIAAGYLNFALNNREGDSLNTSAQPTTQQQENDAVFVQDGISADDVQTAAEASEDYIATFKTERENTRDREMAYLDAIIASTETDEETKQDAKEQKQEIVDNMTKETTIEGLIKSSNNMDCVATLSTGAITVVVEKEVLTEQEVTQIAQVVKDQTDLDLQDIKILPKN